MRHRKSGRKLNRSNTHRAAMFKNMARALLTYEQIRTTEAKAKELRRIVDKLITLAIRNDLHSRRQAYKVLGSHQMVQRLFDEIGPRFAEAGGGYTRIVKMSQPRKGDCAPMVIIELTKKGGEATTEAPAKEEPKKAPAKKAEKPAEKKEEPKEDTEAKAEETPEAAEKADEE
ncbi:50S ribosomal protein L17 [Pseudodesulfovibrio karagichevae]|uniref:Large ribosomal subunit protein bL17 n=1 Tax=Pseudodesulfovibrio karagichevae TaxID=3239305 RepID=A0ABV4K481_9BACT